MVEEEFDGGEPNLADKLTLISSFYSIESVMPAIHKLSPTKLVLFVHSEQDDTVKGNIAKLRPILSSVMEIEAVEADIFDIVGLASKVVKVIEHECKAQNRVVVNITGGRKIQALGVLFGAYARADQVERIVYGGERDSQLYDLPKMSFNMGNTKIKVLREVAGKEKKSVSEIADTLAISPPMAYVHLRELKAAGYINDNYEVTMAGKLAML